MIDLTYEDKNTGKKAIVDWKTSDYQNINDFYQLCIYALHHKVVFGIDVANLSIFNEYLCVSRQMRNTIKYPISGGDLDRIKGLIKGSNESITEFLAEQLEQGLIEENVMLLPETQNKKSCTRYSFRVLCRIEG